MPADATVALDLSRLLSRAGRETATGIDRVEFAYAEHALEAGDRSCFAAMSPVGAIGLLPRDHIASFVRETAAAWHGEADRVRRMLRLSRCLRAGTLWRGTGALAAQMRQNGKTPAYLLVSHHHLEQQGAIARLKVRSGGKFVCLIHDLIPIRFPEYAKPGQNTAHLRRIESAVAVADAVVVNSGITRDTLLPHLDRTGRKTPVLVAPFGTDLVQLPQLPEPEPPSERPYFVYVSTIEARKNHLLLLNLWRDMTNRLGPEAPQLVLVGARGWESENVFDMLDRCPAVQDSVVEHRSLPDSEMARLLRGARAVLLPSFAEGFGFPLIEGLALGAPALCSDIPALHETGGDVPEYLDPLDGMGWRQAILDYAAPQSPRRAAQIARLKAWRPASWDDHFAQVDALIEETVAA
ncbi:MAG TPA: glycosyltransferase family 1 protein [Stellaceae bacterium]